MDAGQVRAAIAAAFPTEPVPRVDALTRAGDDYWERRAVRSALKYRAWTTVPGATLWRHRADLIWLAPRGFGYFIAAWMRHSLVDPETAHYTLSALADYPAWLPEGDAGDGLTAAQLDAVIEFLRWVAATDPSPAMTTSEARRASEAIERYWRPRRARP